jgi:hypothetical protein
MSAKISSSGAGLHDQKPNDPDAVLKESLDAFETSLATPIVSGELDVWADQVRTAWAEAEPLIKRQLTHWHPKQCQEIIEQDPGLATEVEKLGAEDAALEAERACLGRLVAEVSRVAPIVEPDERKVTDGQTRLVDKGIAFVARLKKQQVAVRTWFQEAFNRDRGTVD